MRSCNKNKMEKEALENLGGGGISMVITKISSSFFPLFVMLFFLSN
jgi:hypothetical protein